jgi:hypothetical protein
MRATAVEIRLRREPRSELRDGSGLGALRSLPRQSFRGGRVPVGPSRGRGVAPLALAIGLAIVAALAAAEWQASRSVRLAASWQSDLDRVSVALADKDLDAAAEAWAHAYRNALAADGDWRAPVALAETWQELVRRAGRGAPRVSGVRTLYLIALARAFAGEDLDGVIVIGSALGDLGDLDGVERALRIGRRLAKATSGEGRRAEVDALESRLTAVQTLPDADRPTQ